MIWTEKYRPLKLEDVITSKSIKDAIQAILDNPEANFTNLLLSGPAGAGKTSISKIIPKTLDLPYIYINASEENGIETLRTKIKDFSMSMTIDGKLKVIILDEAEGLTPAFQNALRNSLEETHKSTRYILTCNYPEKIIAPLHSRLKEIVFGKADEKLILKRLVEILRAEKIEIPKEQGTLLVKLIKKFYPDIRKMINYLQYFSTSGKLDIVFENIVSVDIFEKIIGSIKNKRLSEIREILRNNKIDYEVFIRKIFDEVLKDDSLYFTNLTEPKRAEIILLCSDTLFKSSFVVDKEINFACFCVELSKIGI